MQRRITASGRSDYWNRYWTRRSLLGVSGAAAAAFLVGCRGDDESDSSQPSVAPSGEAAEQPRTGGILRPVGQGDPATLDLHQSVSVVTTGPAAPMFNGLLQMNPHEDGEIIPDLAIALPEQPDEQTYVFKIPPDVHFHNGSIVTAEDVKANYEWMINPPEGKTSTRQTILESVIDSIEIPNATTIRFNLKYPSASFLINQTVEFMAIGPKAVLDADGELGKNPIGTGPFKLKEYRPGVSVELERFPGYFRSGRPYLDGIVVHILPDRRTALENFLAGNVHMIAPTAEETAEIEARLGDDAELVSTASNSRNMIFMMTEKPPFNDPRVREALSLLFDREEHLALVHQGRGVAGGSYMAPAPAGAWALPEERIREIPGYAGSDLARAKALLEAAGVTEGTEWQLISRNIYQDLVVWCVEQLRKAGIHCTPQLLDSGAAYAAGNSGQFDLLPWNAVPALDDPDAVFGDIGGMTFAARNWSRTNDPEVDRLFNEQSRTLDAEKRRQTVNELDYRLLSTFQTIVFGYPSPVRAHLKKVRNKTYLMNEDYTNRTCEDVWLDE